MRTLEIGLHALAQDVGVVTPKPLTDQNWQVIIDQTAAEIVAKGKAPGGPSANPKIAFWSAAAVHFHAFKDAWRNQTMHPKASYSEGEAENIYVTVDVFVKHLATQLSEPETAA